MRNLLCILACLVVVVALSSSYCRGGCNFRCKCGCHEGVETCEEYCWRCAHTHHEDCECGCHDDPYMERSYKSRNDFCRRRNCDKCQDFHFDREYSTDYGMRKGLLPKKRPYLHPVKGYRAQSYSFDADCCE